MGNESNGPEFRPPQVCPRYASREGHPDGAAGMPQGDRKLCARCCTPIRPLAGQPESANSRRVPCDDDEVRTLPPRAAQFRDQQKKSLGVTDAQLSDRLHHDKPHGCFRLVETEIAGLRAGTADSANGVARGEAGLLRLRPWVEAAGLGAACAWRGSARRRASSCHPRPRSSVCSCQDAVGRVQAEDVGTEEAPRARARDAAWGGEPR